MISKGSCDTEVWNNCRIEREIVIFNVLSPIMGVYFPLLLLVFFHGRLLQLDLLSHRFCVSFRSAVFIV